MLSKKDKFSFAMAIAKGMPITTELVQDLFKLDSTDQETCERARMFLVTATQAIDDLRWSGTCGDTSSKRRADALMLC